MAYNLTFYPTFGLVSILTDFPAYILTFFLASIPTFYLTSFQAFILALFLASVSGISSDILSGILSGISWRFFVIEVRRGTLWSGACGGGPAGLSAFSKPWNRAAAGKRPGRLAAHGMMNHLSAPPALLLSLPMVSPFFCASCQQLERADWLAPSATPQDACGCHFAFPWVGLWLFNTLVFWFSGLHLGSKGFVYILGHLHSDALPWSCLRSVPCHGTAMSEIYFDITMNFDPEVAVGVWRGTLRSRACSWGPARSGGRRKEEGRRRAGWHKI